MNEKAYFPKQLPFADIPQLLSVNCEGNAYRLVIETFHLNSEVIFSKKQREHQHDIFHAVLYLEGNNFFQYQGTERLCRPGTLILTGPGETHNFAPCRTGKVRYHEITFSLRNIKRVPLRCSFSELFGHYFSTECFFQQMPWQLDIAAVANIEQFYIEIERVLGSQTINTVTNLYGQFNKLLLSIYDCGNQGNDNSLTGINSSVMQAKAYIDQNIGRSPGLGEIAQHAGLAPEYLCREFKRITGCTPIVYRDSQRIIAAKRMLRYSGRSIKEIAELLGFADVYYFSRVFKKIVGIPPGKYRGN
jgi:AraC-like DNA-binding protein